jgi:hypothetical protein
MWNAIWLRIWDLPAMGIIGGFAAIGFIAGNYIAYARSQSTANGMWRGVEAVIVAVLGGLLARGFMSCVLGLGHDSPASRLVVGWSFFLWPGAIDTYFTAAGHPLFSATAYLYMATVVGAFGGMMDGLHRIHNWAGLGVVEIIADFTWGLVGTTNGCLLHFYNLFTARHAPDVTDERQGAHRYLGGFKFKDDFVVTEGSVMSNGDRETPGTPIYDHELVHVLQNRVFGPFFSLTSVLWIASWLPAGFLAGAVSKRYTASQCIQWSSYMNSPWEVWAYSYGGRRSLGDPQSAVADAVLPMSGLSLAIFASLYGVGSLIAAALVIRVGWFS